MLKPKLCFGFFIVCVSLFGSVCSDESLLFPEDEEQGELCDPGTGTNNGHCTPIESCPSALQAISSGKVPVLCRFKGKDPVVCCLKVKKTVGVSKDKDSAEKNKTSSAQTNATAANAQKPLAQAARRKLPYLKYPGCGQRRSIPPIQSAKLEANSSKRPSVAGGEIAVPFTWPWMVAIFSSTLSSSRPRFHCGGSLISDQYILTAAHCFISNRDPSKYYAVIEAHERSRGYVHGLSAIIVHENYTHRAYYDDIALLRLTLPTQLNENITKTRPVCLPSPTLAAKSMDGREVTVTGWGDTSFGGSDSAHLREAKIKIVSRLRCNATYAPLSKFRFPKGIDSRMLCAGVADGSKDACMGDSGGPLVLMDGLWTQVGIVSFGYRCAEPGYPGVYTKVSEYLEWIAKHTNIPRIED